MPSQNAVIPFDHPCPIRDVLDRIGDQWSLLVLETLAVRTFRFNELNKEIGDISKQMLSRTLKKLEADGFVERTLFPGVPPRVDYTLTELGRSFLVPMKALVQWADVNHLSISKSRHSFRLREEREAQGTTTPNVHTIRAGKRA
ncbi:winged helix-turn-helix transcriptional regulator [Ottowia thiooxydans]|uniref:winged helix-turn-helix transcriptional regulator n=1 Tax=Ottowia thiooxydans TaxID=219182 RepID=UPI0006852034|nr:helix-turn-helix domain-containing protein [Ottowia thiooxydans]